MNKIHLNPFQGNSDVWITPQWITDPLGPFDLDPCAAEQMPWEIARKSYTIIDDGLSQKWYGFVWCNPPFSRSLRESFMQKMMEHNNGIILLPAACETDVWKKYVFGTASGVFMLHKRPYFCDMQGKPGRSNSGQTIALVGYGVTAYFRLKKQHNKIGTLLVEVDKQKDSFNV